jgi:hypothetical protein
MKKDYIADASYKGYKVSGKIESVRSTGDDLVEARVTGIVTDEDEDGADLIATWQKSGWIINIDCPLLSKRLELDDNFNDFVIDSVQEILDNYLEKKSRTVSALDDDDDDNAHDEEIEVDDSYIYGDDYDPNY